MERFTYILGSGKPEGENPKGVKYVDRVAWEGIDIVLDFETKNWPIPTGSGLHLNATHVLEHIENLANFMDECHRILSPGGSFFIEVPIVNNIQLAFSDPTHKRFFTKHTFINYFTVEGVHKFGYFKNAWSILHISSNDSIVQVHLAPVPQEYLTDDVLLALNNIK
jgi:predicted SAM-dependent methyltransferase